MAEPSRRLFVGQVLGWFLGVEREFANNVVDNLVLRCHH
jgi:hypothetical protein